MVEIPDEIRNDLEFVFISKIDELLVAAIEGWPGSGGGEGDETDKVDQPKAKKAAPKKSGNGDHGSSDKPKPKKAPARKRTPPSTPPPS